MKKTDLYLKPGTYIKSSTTSGEVQGISLENFVVSVLNNPTCCPKPPGSPDGMLMTALPLNLTLQTVTDFVGNNSAIQLSTLRLGIRSDSSVTTQVSSVIQATTTNANLVIAPNGGGALISQIPDGTTAGGNARGNNSVDFSRGRIAANAVASGTNSGIFSGFSNRASGSSSNVGGGDYNAAIGGYAHIGGGINNTASSDFSTISGGQSNTVSTGTHATVVGGQGNTASGQWAIAGGQSSVSSGARSIALGAVATASGNFSFAFGLNSNVQGLGSVGIGYYAQTSSNSDIAFASGTGRSYLYNQKSHGNSWFTSSGNAQFGSRQFSELLSWKEPILTTAATTVLSLDGTGVTNLIIPEGNNRMWKVKVEWVATVTTITGTTTGITVGNYVYGESSFGFKRLAGTSTMGNMLSDSEASDNAIMDTCLMTYTAGASQELALTFTGPTFSGGGSVTMRVVAKVALVEVAF